MDTRHPLSADRAEIHLIHSPCFSTGALRITARKPLLELKEKTASFFLGFDP